MFTLNNLNNVLPTVSIVWPSVALLSVWNTLINQVYFDFEFVNISDQHLLLKPLKEREQSIRSANSHHWLAD